MSMISAQCDQLRERAKELCSLAPDPAVPYLVPSTKETMALAMRSAASEMEDAANTIWELRCKLVDIVADLQEALAENAKLRELVAQRTAKRVTVSNSDTDHATGHCECGACGGAIDPFDTYCRHCGASLEEDA